MSRIIRSVPPIVALGATLAMGARPAAAQAACTPPAPADSGEAVVVIRAHVHADALVFESHPETRVTLNGCDAGEAGRVTSNLPDPIEPGVRYTDVEITAEYRVRLDFACHIASADARRICDEIVGRRGAPDAPPERSTREE